MEKSEHFEEIYNPILGKYVIHLKKGFSKTYLEDKVIAPTKVSLNADFSEFLGKPSKQKNSNLREAKKDKYDEFYTTFEDVDKELYHYKNFFKGKIVYMPCDKVLNKGRSEFVNFFTYHFKEWGIKKLVITQYIKNGNGIKKEFGINGLAFEYNGECDDSMFVDESEFVVTALNGDGSFSSKECIEIMNECDVVVTNPPFSLFRQFVNQIMKLEKKFIIIGNKNAITYKEIFPYIKDNKIWLGYTSPKDFITPFNKIIDEKSQYMIDGIVYQKLSGLCYWFTNVEHNKRKEIFYPQEQKKYNPIEFPKYDNYDAINVEKLDYIPIDYNGVMGVPITILEHYNPNQIEIIGHEHDLNGNNGDGVAGGQFMVNGKGVYKRILIRKKSNSNQCF